MSVHNELTMVCPYTGSCPGEVVVEGPYHISAHLSLLTDYLLSVINSANTGPTQNIWVWLCYLRLSTFSSLFQDMTQLTDMGWFFRLLDSYYQHFSINILLLH